MSVQAFFRALFGGGGVARCPRPNPYYFFPSGKLYHRLPDSIRYVLSEVYRQTSDEEPEGMQYIVTKCWWVTLTRV